MEIQEALEAEEVDDEDKEAEDGEAASENEDNWFSSNVE